MSDDRGSDVEVEEVKKTRKRHRRSKPKAKSSANKKKSSHLSSEDNSDQDGGLVAQVLKQIAPAIISPPTMPITPAVAPNNSIDATLTIRHLELQQENLKLQLELERLKRQT